MKKPAIRNLIPNLVTLSGLCFGITSMRFALEGQYQASLICILIAAVCDLLDGMMASLLQAHSELGAQLDSLADFVNFGIAPSLLLYMSLMSNMGLISWLSLLLFIIFCCLRLALFNINNSDLMSKQNNFFKGVPTPAGAILILIPVTHSFIGFDWWTSYQNLLAFYTLTISFLLISNIPTYSLKNSSFQLKRSHSFRILVVFFALVLLLINFLWIVVSILAIAYLLSMPFSINSFRKSKMSSVI
jgi:CDP-diacylglycerol--serine O-phosphatidyltransferase